ncbi:MAG: hypothetical protein AAF907_12515, partial [Planctomycetota bacterium]
MPVPLRRRSVLGAGLAALLLCPLNVTAADDAEEKAERAKPEREMRAVLAKALKLDTEAKFVDFYEGQEDGTFSVKVVAKDEKGGQLLIANEGDEPITIQIPDGIV